MTSLLDPARNAGDVVREAQQWHLRLKDPSATDDDRRAFDLWRSTDVAHERAYAEAVRMWNALSKPASALGASGWHHRDRRRSRALSFALAASIALIATTLWWRDPGIAARTFADYATAPGAQASLQLADGSRVLLDSDSAMDVQIDGASRSVSLLRGRAWFDVTHDERRPFSVSAGNAIARVLGTSFIVDRRTDSTIVTVERGRVATYATADGKAVELRAGEQARVSGELSAAAVTVSLETISAWRRGLVVFDQATLDSVAQEIGRLGAGRVVIPDADLRNLKLSGVFSSANPDAVVEAIEAGLGLHATRIPGIAIIIHR